MPDLVRTLSPRPVANHEISEHELIETLANYLRENPLASCSSLLGPLVRKESEVSPVSLVRSASLLNKLLASGHEKCVFLPARLSAALLHITWKKGLSSDPVFEADAVVTHLVVLSRIVRRLKRENKCGNASRRYPKTGALRKNNPCRMDVDPGIARVG